MADVICVMGESGSGKTTSLHTLSPSSTFIIDADKKGLNWRGWKEDYSSARRNYIVSDDNESILKYMRAVNDNEKYAGVKVLCVDTINGVMVAAEARDRKKKGYDKWADLAWSVYDLVDYALTMRDDLTVVFMAHTQTERDDSGILSTRIKTSGRKLDKIVLESKFRTVLNAKELAGEYVFETHSPTSTAKVPLGAFASDHVPNDMHAVISTLREFWGMEPIPETERG